MGIRELARRAEDYGARPVDWDAYGRRAGWARSALASPGLGGWLLGLLLVAVAYSVFFSGAINLPEESRLQIGIAGLIVLAGVGLASGALGVARAPIAWAGVWVLALFGLWSAISLDWSVLPDESWLAANRALTYSAVAALALVAAASVRRAPATTALGLGGLVLLVALYALGGKLFPGISLLGIDFNHTADFARLRAPIEYWNALGLFLVLAAPIAIWLASDRDHQPVVRVASLLALTIVVMAAALTYSRGAVLAYLVATAVMVAAGPDRMRRLGIAAAAPLAAAPALALGFTLDDLTGNRVPLSDRTDDGLLLLGVTLLSLGALAAAARRVIALEPTVSWSPARARQAWQGVAAAAGVVAIVAVVAVAASDRGLTGTISHEWGEFTEVKGADVRDPGRLLSTSGSNRWVWWGEAVGAFSDEPLRGWGAGSFPVVHRLYRDEGLEVRQPHSVPLQFFAETGLIGGLLGLGGLALLGVGAVAGIRRSSGGERSARLALTAAGAAWAIHSFYDWDWDIPAVTLPALIAVAVAAAPSGNGSALRMRPAATVWSRELARQPRIWLAAGISLTAAALAISALMPAWSEDRRLAALEIAERAEATPEQLRRAAATAELAERLNPVSIQPLLSSASISIRRLRMREALETLARAARIQPYSATVWRRLIEFQIGVRDRRLLEEAALGAVRADPLGGDFAAASALALLLTPPAESPTATGTPLPKLPPPEEPDDD